MASFDLLPTTNIDELIIAGGALAGGVYGWLKLLRPFFKATRKLYIRVNTFLDQHEELVGVVLTQRSFVDANGVRQKKALADLVVQIVEWQVLHDIRWPQETSPDAARRHAEALRQDLNPI